jgi:hypothetical protein
MDLRFENKRLMPGKVTTARALLCILLLAGLAQAGTNLRVHKVTLTACENPAICETVETRLLRVLNSLDDINALKDDCTNSGLSSLEDLHSKTQFYCVNVLYESHLVNIISGGYEVRGIRVRVPMGATKGNPDRHLVFSFNRELLITDVRFAIPKRNRDAIMGEGTKLQDFANRQKILHFVEVFCTAYNRKDIDYLRRAFSDDALIIVGRVLEKAPEQTDMLHQSSLSREKIRFVKLSKEQYMTGLERVFRNNDFLKVDFDSLEVSQHESVQEVYGVTLKQRWSSSTYSDTGYLFLMIEFMDENQPIVHVRTWQPDRFPDGNLVQLGDFIVVP